MARLNTRIAAQAGRHAGTLLAVDWRKGSDDDTLTAFVRDLLNESCARHEWFRRQAEFNIVWYRGEQLRRWSGLSGRLDTQPNPNNRERLVFNFLKTLVDAFVAKLNNDRIVLETQPATEDIQDIHVSQLQNAVLRYYHEVLHLDNIVHQCDMSAVLTGEAWARVWWDPNAGERIDSTLLDEAGLPADQETAEQLIIEPALRGIRDRGQREEIAANLRAAFLNMGDLRVTCVSPFNIFFGPWDASCIEEIDWLIETQDVSIERAVEQYGIDPQAAAEASPLNPENPRSRILYASPLGAERARTSSVRTVPVCHMWIRPFRSIPGLERGRYVIIAGSEVVRDGPNPYEHGSIPYARMNFMQTPGNPRGETWVTSLAPPQHDLNRTFSHFAEIRNRMSVPRWIAPVGSISDPNEWTNAAGTIAFYQGARPPSQVEGAQIGASWFLLADRIMQLMRDIAGIREISQAKNPAGVRSGTMLSLLRESDDERMNPIARRRRIFWASIGRLMLQTLHQFVTEQRIIRIAGDESAPSTFRFTGRDLAGVNASSVQYFDVIVRTTGISASRSVRMEQLRQLIDAGAINPANPEHARVIFDLVDLGSSTRNLDPEGRWRRLQQARNLNMAQGIFEPPNTWEDHQVLQSELNNFRASMFFQRLPDPIKRLYTEYDKMLLAAMAIRRKEVELIAGQVAGAASALQQAAEGSGLSYRQAPAELLTGIPAAVPPLAAVGAPQQNRSR